MQIDQSGEFMQDDIHGLWGMCLSLLSKRIKKHAFCTWLKPTEVEYVDNKSFNILVPNNFAANWISERYRKPIVEALTEVSEQRWDFNFKIRKYTIQEDIFTSSDDDDSTIKTITNKQEKTKLNPNYLFENYVVGDNNQFAYAACEAVAENLSNGKYNPLFLYGGVGLGKTHLLQAIGNHVYSQHQNGHKILYASSEQFTNDFIKSLGNKSTNQFVDLYRSVDILLLDDIQFFTGKESTQEQFFHTFNALHQSGKQIVLSADRPPRDIRGLEERLLSRFSWGLVVDIQPPTLETRIAILQQKAENHGVTAPIDVLNYIADSVTSNVRVLEGALVRLIAYSSLRNKDLTVDLAREVLKDTINSRHKEVTIGQIQKIVSAHFKVSEEMLKAKKKSQEIVIARQVAMYLARTLTQNSLKSIGAEFGNRDHSTVIHACHQVTDNIKRSVDFKLQIDRLINTTHGG